MVRNDKNLVIEVRYFIHISNLFEQDESSESHKNRILRFL